MLGQGDNLQLALNLFYWLMQDGHQSGEVIRPLDQPLQLSETSRAIFGMFYLFVLPLLLIAIGFIIPWHRKRRQ